MGLRDDVFGTGLQPRRATEAVQPKQFFHGSTTLLNEGDELLPSAKTGRENYDYDAFPDAEERRNSVFFTPREESAWRWGASGSENRRGGGRTYVYEVQPRGDIAEDDAGGAMMAPGAKVKRRIDIPHPHAIDELQHRASMEHNAAVGDHWSTGVQGTLAPMQWGKYVDTFAQRLKDNARFGPPAVRREDPAQRVDPNQLSLFNDRR